MGVQRGFFWGCVKLNRFIASIMEGVIPAAQGYEFIVIADHAGGDSVVYAGGYFGSG
jgi:hypothetical protein